MRNATLAVAAAALLGCSHVQEADEQEAAREDALLEETALPRAQPRGTKAADRPSPDRPARSADKPSDAPAPSAEPDNTRVNTRDRDDRTLTPMDQGNSEQDRRITQDLRKAVVGADELSWSAKNVKIITRDGQVTLRGVVKSAEEKQRIDELARTAAGVTKVDNQLEVAPPSGD